MQSKDEFQDANIDIEFDVEDIVHTSVNKLELHEIDEEKQETYVLHLKDNILPRGLVPLEDLFDFNDVAKKPKIEPTRAGVEEHNIGTELQPKMMKLSKSFTPS